MGKISSSKGHKTSQNSFGNLIRKAGNWLWGGRWWRKLMICLVALILFVTGVLYGVAEWYIHKHSNEPLTLGTTFTSDYAQSYGLDPQQTLNAIFSDLGMRQVRLVSYWSTIEPTPGRYDFSGLDWQFALANKYHAKVSLAIGLRQPRWPECHPPSWANVQSSNESSWEPQLNKFIVAVIDHYKNNPALKDYELENEYFNNVFGTCTDFSRQRLINEFNLAKETDPSHPIIVSRSNNWVGIPIGQPTPDEFAISVYKRVWDNIVTHRYFEYPLPSWFYSALAGSEEILSGKDMIIHELQTEPWTPKGEAITDTPLSEQFKSMDAARLKSRIAYGEDTGMRTIDLWGAEWWYWLKEKKGDPSVWNVVKQAVAQAAAANQKLEAKNH